MRTKRTKFTDDGTLLLPDWKFSGTDVSGTDARMPHRAVTVAAHVVSNTTFIVTTNHGRAWWVRAVGPGFAGPHSRASHTVGTRNPSLASAWIAAVNAGKVGIE